MTRMIVLDGTGRCRFDPHGCGDCRDRDGGRRWRQSLIETGRVKVPGDVADFDCPWGVTWGARPPVTFGKPVADEGRRRWREHHARALAWDGSDPEGERRHVLALADALAGCGCVRRWREYVVANPPDLSTPAAYFAWGVAAHNVVNRQLGKRKWSVEEATAAVTSAEGSSRP